MLEQERYVREKLRELDIHQDTWKPISVPLKRPAAPVVRGTGRALLWLGKRLESWAQPAEGDASELTLRGKTR
jgi:hypothetical protein